MQGLRAERRAPRMIVIENVTGLLTSHGGKDFDAICDALAACDYRVGAVVIDAALFVPQSRERVFIIGVGSDADIPAELVADGPTAPFHPPTLVAACQRQPSAPIWWRLPIPPVRNSIFADIIEDEPKGVSWHTKAETDRLLELMAPHMSPRSRQRNAPAGGWSAASTGASVPIRTAKRSNARKSASTTSPGASGFRRRIQSSDDRDR